MRARELVPFTILELLLPTDLEAILGVSNEITVTKGTEVPRQETPSELFVVVDGEISLRPKKGSTQEFGRVTTRRSLELKSLLAKNKAWEWKWYAEEETTLLVIPWPRLREALQKSPRRFQYLSLMTMSPELQKLKRDIKALDGEAEDIVDLILAMQIKTFQEILDKQPRERAFFVVSEGRVDLKVALDGTVRPLSSFQLGEYFLYDPAESNFVYEPHDGAKGWCIYERDWNALTSCDRFKSFLETRSGAFASEDGEATRTSFDNSNLKLEHKAGADKTRKESWGLVSRVLYHLKRSRKMVPHHARAWAPAACLSSAAYQLGFSVSPARFQQGFLGLSGQATLDAIASVAEEFGLTTRKAHFANGQGFMASAPTMILLDSRPVLLYSINDNGAKIGDPETGHVRSISSRELQNLWDGEALRVTCTKRARNVQDPPLKVLKYFRLLSGSLYSCFLVFLAGTLSFLFSLTVPMINQYVFERILVDKDWPAGVIVGLGYFVVSLFAALLVWITSLMSAQLTIALDAKLRSAYFQHLIRLPMSAYDVMNKGDVANQVDILADMLDFFASKLVEGAMTVVSILTCGTVLYFYHPYLLYTSIALTPFLAVISVGFGPFIIKLKTRLAQIDAQNNTVMGESFDRFETVTAFNGSRAARWKWEANYIKRSALGVTVAVYDSIFEGVHSFFEAISKIAVLLVAMQLFLKGELSIGKVIAAVFVIERLTPAIWSLLRAVYEWPQVLAGMAQVDPIFTTPAEAIQKEPSKEITLRTSARLTLQNVSFRYSPNSEDIIRNVSLDIAPGEVVAIVGMSGSGKTTLARLLNGLRTPSTGKILIDGRDVSSMSPTSLRQAVGYVPQDGHLFAGTVFENITMYEPDASFEHVARAAYYADAEQFIGRLPKNYSTALNAGGSGLSLGQAQRILITRMLFREHLIYVLDEATSHLDPISEERLVNRVLKKVKGKTVIFVTQHVNLLSRADRVVMIHNRTVVETGKHHELISRRGRYYDFCSRQNSVSY